VLAVLENLYRIIISEAETFMNCQHKSSTIDLKVELKMRAMAVSFLALRKCFLSYSKCLKKPKKL
jgi:ubiquitin C-terminal hydrolase